MTAQECVDALIARGVPAELWNGVPLVPERVLQSIAIRKRVLDVISELGLSCVLCAEGAVITK